MPLPHRETVPLDTPPCYRTISATKCILIADDDVSVRGSLPAVIDSEGYLVEEARVGIEAVRRCIQHPPDLVLLDLDTTESDGWTTFSQIDNVQPLVPVIVITTLASQYEKAVRLGVDAFIEKPLTIEVLVGAIKRFAHEDANQHIRRITDRRFVTELLLSSDS
jgi:DNA-binding NtrC family response regulator